jgi:hypothetical protein
MTLKNTRTACEIHVEGSSVQSRMGKAPVAARRERAMGIQKAS